MKYFLVTLFFTYSIVNYSDAQICNNSLSYAHLNINNVDIKRYAVTFGLGMPLPHDRASSAFYKVNFSAEIGKRGEPTNGLVQENYINLNLAFTLNDKWFTRFAFQ